MEELIIPQGLHIAIIVATDTDRAIGKDNQIPWKHKADMRLFRETTLSHMVLMGRMTFDSIHRKPLPHRHNIVLSSTLDPRFHDQAAVYPSRETTSCTVKSTLQEAVNHADVLRKLVCSTIGHDMTLFVIGGQKIYEAFMPYAEWVCHNVIETRIKDADAHFPEMSQVDWAHKLTVQYKGKDQDLPWRKQLYERRQVEG